MRSHRPRHHLRPSGDALRRHPRRLRPDARRQRQRAGDRRHLRCASRSSFRRLTTLSNGFSQIAKQVGPAVVNINTESLPKQSTTKEPPSPRPASSRWTTISRAICRTSSIASSATLAAGDDDDGDGRYGPGERRALGSGFIVDPSGYIITNNHVVDKADKIYVKLSSDPDGGPDSEGRLAKVVGTDKDTDIAVIKIETDKPLPTVKLGNSDGAQVGDWVLAIGSPFGLSQTVSAGIVSAKNRSIDEARRPPASRSRSSRSSSRPTPPSTPATPAVRSSTWPARSSA